MTDDGALHRRLANLSPRSRRWRRFLRSLPLTAEGLPADLEPLGDRNFIICGSPRTGTTLLSAALFQPPHCVTVMEPWDGMRLPPAELFRSLREEIRATGRLCRGRLDLGRLTDSGEVAWCQEGESSLSLAVDPSYSLGVKWPGYWQIAERLPTSRVIVCVRNREDVLRSYESAGGRVSQGLQYDMPYNDELNRMLVERYQDVDARRQALYDHIQDRLAGVLHRRNVLTVSYEQWVNPTAQIERIAEFLQTPLGHPPVAVRMSRARPSD